MSASLQEAVIEQPVLSKGHAFFKTEAQPLYDASAVKFIAVRVDEELPDAYVGVGKDRRVGIGIVADCPDLSPAGEQDPLYAEDIEIGFQLQHRKAFFQKSLLKAVVAVKKGHKRSSGSSKTGVSRAGRAPVCPQQHTQVFPCTRV